MLGPLSEAEVTTLRALLSQVFETVRSESWQTGTKPGIR
jgi:hypothetical protein